MKSCSRCFAIDCPRVSTPPRASTTGVALVLVLALLVLITGLVIAFFTTVQSESVSTNAAVSITGARTLSDAAVNLVIAQITDGTTSGAGATGTTTQSWASQPGMIRTYDSNGNPVNDYKLYSSDTMVQAGTASISDVPSDWNSSANSEVYTDLNAPVLDNRNTLNYPILDPDLESTLAVAGFSYASPASYSGTIPSAVNNPVPMPVKWLYVLSDGTLVPPTSGTGGTLTIPGATASNPITGRMAFWTDDESAKVNINTASEGLYWDVPRLFTRQEVGARTSQYEDPGYARHQPANREYQRYPGHPATTSLSTIFHNLLPVPDPSVTWTHTNAQTYSDQIDPYYNLAPRVAAGGSKNGTQLPGAAVTLDSDRLYASIDELLFRPDSNGPSNPVRSTNPSPAPAPAQAPTQLSAAALEKAKFFLTADSNSPEVTLYNTPRIGIWPVYTDATKRTAYDQLAAFCGTIGGKEFYFTRQGGSPSGARSSTADLSARNLQLYRYLQAMTSQSIPGFGGNFAAKYGAGNTPGVLERDQILTSIYDYIRCINLGDKTNANPYTPIPVGDNVNVNLPGFGEVLPIRIPATGGGTAFTQGFGRWDTISAAGLLLCATSDVVVPTAANPNRRKTNGLEVIFLTNLASPMQGHMGHQPNTKMRVQGLDKLVFSVRNTAGSWVRIPTTFPGDATNVLEDPGARTWHGRSMGGTEGPAVALADGLFTTSKLRPGATVRPDGRGVYPFVSPAATFTPPPDLAGSASDAIQLTTTGDHEITIQTLAQDTGALIQTLHLRFPDTYLKVPGMTNPVYRPFSSRIDQGALGYGAVTGNYFCLIQGQDTLITLQAGGAGNLATAADRTAGDYRMYACLSDVPSSYFRLAQSHPAFITGPVISETNPTQFAHNMTTAAGTWYYGTQYGNFVANPGYPNVSGTPYRLPDLPDRVGATSSSANTGVQRVDGGPGDWDTGLGMQKDGAYLNMAEEGEQFVADPLRTPYVTNEDHFAYDNNAIFFSPNRQISSPMMFGSIPTGVQRNRPWQTLLFHSAPEDPSHPGKASPPDHLLADLFWMPVVEPYAISQPFSTSGKINMNYQIQPFTYIKRSTGIQAVMKSTLFAAVPPAYSTAYKPFITTGDNTDSWPAFIPDSRYAIDLDKTRPNDNTLAAFETKFSNNQLFKSATEICEMNLVPFGAGYSGNPSATNSMSQFWLKYGLTGDNLREKPYSDLYGRLTTKSNAFTVHVRVQALKKNSTTAANTWVPNKDSVSSEYRGSSLIERYIDVNDPNLPDFATKFTSNPSDPTLNIDQYFKFRVVSTKRFAP